MAAKNYERYKTLTQQEGSDSSFIWFQIDMKEIVEKVGGTLLATLYNKTIVYKS